MESLSKIYEQRRKDSSVIKQMERLNQIKAIFNDLQNRTDQRKIECTLAFKKFVSNFEQWIEVTLQTLQSGELVTTDILQFEGNLMVIFEFNHLFSFKLKYLNDVLSKKH